MMVEDWGSTGAWLYVLRPDGAGGKIGRRRDNVLQLRRLDFDDVVVKRETNQYGSDSQYGNQHCFRVAHDA